MSAEDRITCLQSTFMDEEKMAFLKPYDFWFDTPKELTDKVKKNSMPAMIIWQDGKCSFTRMSWKVLGFPFRDQLDQCWGTMFGTINAKIGFVPNYRSTGKGMWTFEFTPDNILAWRCALMTEEDFNLASSILRPSIRYPLSKIVAQHEEKKSPDVTEEANVKEHISIFDVRRGLTDGDIIIGTEDDVVVAELGDCIIHFCDSDDDFFIETASVHIDTTPFEEDVIAICDAINAMPDAKIRYCYTKLKERFRERDSKILPDQIKTYPSRDQVANVYKYLNWENTHKNPYDMTDAEVEAAKEELANCYPGIAWVATAGYKQMVPQDKTTGHLILA